MLLVGTAAPSEIVAGVAAAAVAATAVEVIRRRGVVRFRPDPRWLGRAAGLPWQTLAEFGRLMAALWRALVLRRRVVGRFSEVPFRVGGNDSRSAARRAVFTAGASFAPNTYVVDFDRGKGTVLVHQLLPPHPKDAEDLLP
jgi:Na+/H+ ion antiporter subunit